MVSGQEYHVGLMLNDQWKHYQIRVVDWHSDFEFTMQRLAGNPDVYIRKWNKPTLAEYDFRPYLSGDETVQISNETTIPLDTGTYYISVHARPGGSPPAGGGGLLAGTRGGRTPIHSFKITATHSSKASIHSGMGAIPYTTGVDGVAFRLWAPNASSVHASGEFNNWSSNAAPMISEGNGHWSLDYRYARPGLEYKYVIQNGAQTLWRNDPREQEITNSTGNSVIFDDTYSWNDGSFSTPSWNEMIIYEMHVGTLNDLPGGIPGNFDSAIARLDHIRDLGVNCVCVMPVNEFPGDFSWGYNPSYPFSVESIYGGANSRQDRQS